MQTLKQILQTHRSADRSITFITGKQEESVLSYQALYQRAASMLRLLQLNGLKAGDELIIFLRDNEKFVIAFWAAVLGGIVPVPVAVGISDEHRAKLFRIFAKLQRPHLYTDQENIDRLSGYAFAHALGEEFSLLKAKTVSADIGPESDLQGKLHEARPTDTAFIQFSSGSTSEPKGVVLSHQNLVTNMRAIAKGAQYTEQDISLSWMPLTHDMGLIGFHLNMLFCNMSQCLIPTELFSRRPLLWLQKASEKKANVLCSPNFGYKHFLKALGDKQPDGLDLSHVRLIYNGAEPISIDLCEEFLNRMAAYGLRRETMFTVYGLAEASLAVAFPEYGRPYRAVHIDRHAVQGNEPVKLLGADAKDAVGFAIVGKAVESCSIRITDQDGKVLADDHIGDIEIKGDNVTRGYYLNDEANAEALAGDGWLKTGDLGFLHKGELVITGRAKEIIFANGQNYYPHDLESVLYDEASFELGKVVACGVHEDIKQKELLLIFVLYRADPDSFQSIANKARRIINEQLGLEVTEVIPVRKIPKTTSGKIQRRALANAYLNGEFDAVLVSRTDSRAPQEDVSSEDDSKEAQLQRIFNTALEDKTINLDDNFFELGISSLVLAEIHQRIDEVFPGEIDITDLFEYQTINELAAFLRDKDLKAVG